MLSETQKSAPLLPTRLLLDKETQDTDASKHPEQQQSTQTKISQKEQDRQRFVAEFEFVQCLSNPDYLQWLAKQHYFEKEAFTHYLCYLQYWKRPEYASYILFPQCLRMLDALQDPLFRNKLHMNETILELKRQQSHQWIYFDQHYEDVQKAFQYQL